MSDEQFAAEAKAAIERLDEKERGVLERLFRLLWPGLLEDDGAPPKR